MNAITIRNLSEDAAKALEARAAENGRTAEAEIERILEDLLVPRQTIEGHGSAAGLVAAFRQLREEYPELEDMEFPRDQTVARGVSFE